MHAVIKTGGKQYRVAPGEKLKIEQIPSDIGSVVTLDQVMAVSNGDKSEIGEPLVSGASVSATVLDQGKAAKIRIFKMRRRKHYRKSQGHRQLYTEIFISGIESSLGSETADAGEALAKAKARRASLDLAAQGGSPDAVAAMRRSYKDGIATPAAADVAADDLSKIEGVGPKIAELLQAAGIKTFADLAGSNADDVKKILTDAGGAFAAHDPSTWAEQSTLAAAGKWDELKTLQDELDGGRRNS